MPIITRFPPRLAQALRHVSGEVGKRFIVKTNPVLQQFEEVPLSIGMQAKGPRYGKYPIYVNSTNNFDRHGNIAPHLEYSIAFDAASYCAYAEGYKRSGIKIFSLDSGIEKMIGAKALAVLKDQLRECFDEAYDLGNALISNNIVSGLDYDPFKDHYEERIAEFMAKQKHTFTNRAVLELGAKIGLNMEEHPEMAKLMVFDGIIRLAKLYLYIPEYYRGELLRNVGSFWRDHLESFFKMTEIDLDARYLVGSDFQRFYTIQQHQKLLERIFSYIEGSKGYVETRYASDTEMDDRNIEAAINAHKECDFFAAFSYYNSVQARDVSREIGRELMAMKISVLNRFEFCTEDQVKFLVLRELVLKYSLETAIAFQESEFGIDADLDPTFRMYD